MMKKALAILTLLTLSACGVGKAGDGVTFAHNPSIPCPAPAPMDPEVMAAFNQYSAGDPLMMGFYKHYIQQQQQLAAFAQHQPSQPNCPTSFWVEGSVATKFRDLPVGHPLRNFFIAYVEQQREIDNYYTVDPGMQQ